MQVAVLRQLAIILGAGAIGGALMTAGLKRRIDELEASQKSMQDDLEQQQAAIAQIETHLAVLQERVRGMSSEHKEWLRRAFQTWCQGVGNKLDHDLKARVDRIFADVKSRKKGHHNGRA